MKAVIMAGGKGTRLRPLTCDLPKPMVPVVNYPVMEHIINLLKRHGIKDIAVTTYYLPGIIEEYFTNGEKWGVDLHYFREESPLGTAGSVHNADKFLDETFLVISGDAISDFNLEKAINFHKKREADVTLILTKEEIPLDYGVVMTDNNGKIVRFLEKPNWGQVFSDTINTGIYILEPEIFNYYKKGEEFDFSKDLFPLMLKEGKKLYGIALEGYWNDIGNLEEYHKTQFDFLNGKINLSLQACCELGERIWVEDGVIIDEEAKLQGPLFIGKGTNIDKGVYLENSVIGRNNIISPYTSIKYSVLWDNNYIGENCELRGTNLSSGISLKERVAVFDRSAIGKKVVVEKESRIKPGIKIWPEKKIESRTEVEDNIIWVPYWSRYLFSNSGIVGMSNIDITPEFCARLATSYGSTLKKDQGISISSDSYKITNALKRTIIGGLQSAGINVVDIGDTITSIARYSVKKLRTQGGLHIQVSHNDPKKIVIEFFNKQGINISSSAQKGIEKNFATGDYNRATIEEIGEYAYAPEMNKSYIDDIMHEINFNIIRKYNFSLVMDYEYDNLMDVMPIFLKKLNIRVYYTKNYSSNGLPLSLDERLKSRKRIAQIIRDNKCDLGVILDHNAKVLTLLDEKGKMLNQSQYQVLISYLLLEKGMKEIFIPINASLTIENMARDYGAKINYTTTSLSDTMKKYYDYLKSKQKNISFSYFYPYNDAISGLGLVLEKLAMEEISLLQLLNKLPEFYLNNAEIPCTWRDKGRVMRYLTEEIGKDTELLDGVKFKHEQGWALVIPDSERAVFHIFAEGQDEETAESLTGFYLERVKGLILKEE